jgi:putative two-component system response regulator
VGKIGIPDHILLKPGKLDPDEWEIMKTHTIIGGRILEGASAKVIETARIIALTHHEKWDGSGYPSGLKGREIPLESRIVAVADVFDALRSARPYKKPFDYQLSLAIMKQDRGHHFDPQVLDAFLSIQEEIFAIDRRYRL